MTHIPMYFNLKDGEVVFDQEGFDRMINSQVMTASVAEREEAMSRNFGEIFTMTKSITIGDGPDSDDTQPNIEE